MMINNSFTDKSPAEIQSCFADRNTEKDLADAYAVSSNMFWWTADNIDDYDILIGFSYDGDNWNYSLRSTKVDCAVLAMKYGGGGHKGAAGFSNPDFVLRKL